MTKQEILELIDEKIADYPSHYHRKKATLFDRLASWLAFEDGWMREQYRQEVQKWKFLREVVEKADCGEELVRLILDGNKNGIEFYLDYLGSALEDANGDERNYVFWGSVPRNFRGFEPWKEKIIGYFVELLSDWVPSKELTLRELDREIAQLQEQQVNPNKELIGWNSPQHKQFLNSEIQNHKRMRELVATSEDIAIETLAGWFSDNETVWEFNAIISFIVAKTKGETGLASPAIPTPLCLAQYHLVDRYRCRPQ